MKIAGFFGRANRRARDVVHGQVTRLPARWIANYYRLSPWEFTREYSSVSSGMRRYRDLELSKHDLYHLRRNIHMLEKGLVMRPRRNEFAISYIEETALLFEVILVEPNGASRDELQWCADVLGEYFMATLPANNPKIRRAYEICRNSLTLEFTPKAGSCGPAAPLVHAEAHKIIDVESLQLLAQNRRSVRWFTPDRVGRNIVDKAIEIGMESPTACNRQPYRFVVLDSPESAVPIAKIAMGTAGFAEQIPGLIVVVGDLSAFFDERDRHLIYIDGCLASMGLLLGLEAQSVASCVINWPDIPEREREIRSKLRLDQHEQVIMLIAYGYADPVGLAPSSAKRSVGSAREYFDSDVIR